MYPPRAGDLTREEIRQKAEELIQKGGTIYFKFTCSQCGERCTASEPNTMYPQYECHACGLEQTPQRFGLLLVYAVLPTGEHKST